MYNLLPSLHVAIYEEADPALADFVNDVAAHKKMVANITGGRLEFKYIPISQVIAAPEMLDALKKTQERMQILVVSTHLDTESKIWRFLYGENEINNAVEKATKKI